MGTFLLINFKCNFLMVVVLECLVVIGIIFLVMDVDFDV